MKRKILVLMGTLILIMTVNGWTEEEKKSQVKYNLGEVIVTATKTEVYQAETGSSTTVITGEEIKRKSSIRLNLLNLTGILDL